MHELRHHGRRLPRHAPGDTQGPRPGSAAEARKPEPTGVTNAGNCTDQPSATVNTTISCNGNCAKVLPCTSQSDREPRLKNNATAVKPRCREAAKARARRRTAAAWRAAPGLGEHCGTGRRVAPAGARLGGFPARSPARLAALSVLLASEDPLPGRKATNGKGGTAARAPSPHQGPPSACGSAAAEPQEGVALTGRLLYTRLGHVRLK